MANLCPLCGAEITDPAEVGPVGHLMKTHKRTEAEAMDLINATLNSPEQMAKDDIYGVYNYLTNSKNWWASADEAWQQWITRVCEQERNRQDQMAYDILNNSFLPAWKDAKVGDQIQQSFLRSERLQSHWTDDSETILHKGLDRRTCPTCSSKSTTFTS